MNESKKVSTIKTIKRILPMFMKATPLYFTLFVLIALIHGLSWSFMVNVTQNLFDTVEQSVFGDRPLHDIWWALAFFGITSIIQQLLTAFHSFMYVPFNEYSKGYFSQKMHQKVSRLPLVAFENPDVMNTINKADEGVNKMFGMVFNFIMLLTFFLPYIIHMAIYFWVVSPSLSCIILALAIPIIAGRKIETKFASKLEDQSAVPRRQADYYKQCICDPKYFKETRLLGAFEHFYSLFRSSLDCLINIRKENARNSTLVQLSTNVITFLGYIVVLILMIMAVANGKLSVGGFAAFFMALNQLQGRLMGSIGIIGSLGNEVNAVNNYLAFFDLPENEEPVSITSPCGIKLKNVSFTYPDAKESSLQNITLDIKSGETVAFVGENGAGKTTLIRIITGLFKPDQGEVCYTSAPNSQAKKDSYTGLSAVFQNFKKYQLSLKDNVRMSDFNSQEDESSVKSALDYCDFSYNNLDNGLETQLSKEFGGIDLSGGQWQRVAIARGIYRKHHIIILDEPTSAIDPVEETKVYEKFAKMSKGVTSILVTHRLGSAKIADKIVVLDKGRIVEVGGHEELMKNKGKYFEIYSTQAKWYQ